MIPKEDVIKRTQEVKDKIERGEYESFRERIEEEQKELLKELDTKIRQVCEEGSSYAEMFLINSAIDIDKTNDLIKYVMSFGYDIGIGMRYKNMIVRVSWDLEDIEEET